MNYLVIKNKGLIEPEDLYLIGSSTKREDETKIGMFGSGWKFALAWLMRNDCLPKIISGRNVIDIDFKMVLHRNNPVKVITVMGKETSLTSEMGMKWTGWMALREIISNAIDEGEHSITTAWNPGNFNGENDFTTIYIPMNNELSEVLRSFNSYFSFERTVSFENEVGRAYVKREKSEMSIYRKGIRCYNTDKESTIDFDFNDIDIDENRLTTGGDIHYAVKNFVYSDISTSLLKIILQNEFIPYLSYEPNDSIIASLKELIDLGEVFTSPILQGIGGIFIVKNPTLMIPNLWYKKLADLGIIENPFDKFSSDRNAPKDFIRTSNRNISRIEYFLNGLNLKYNIFTGVFTGSIVVSDNNVYINDDYRGDDKSISVDILYNTSKSEFANQLK